MSSTIWSIKHILQSPLPLLPLSALSIILSELCLSIKQQPLDLHCIIHSVMEKPSLAAVFGKNTSGPEYTRDSAAPYSMPVYVLPPSFPTAVTLFLFWHQLIQKCCCDLCHNVWGLRLQLVTLPDTCSFCHAIAD